MQSVNWKEIDSQANENDAMVSYSLHIARTRSQDHGWHEYRKGLSLFL